MSSVNTDPSRNWHTPPTDETTLHGVDHFRFDDGSDTENPFNRNPYDYDKGFYNGEFSFDDPATGAPFTGTPEVYGRRRIVAALATAATSQPEGLTVLDLGSGTLDVARAIPDSIRDRVTILNSDISGPWTGLGLDSSLVRGAKQLALKNEVDSYRGVDALRSVANVQYDFNRTAWPFRRQLFSHVVSSMALHHLRPEKKLPVLASIHDSLMPGGSLIVSDVYIPRRDRPMVTQHGKRGPEECGGYPEAFGRFIARLQEVGFEVDDLAVKSAESEPNYTDADLEKALGDVSATLPVSNGVWFTVAKRSA